MDITILPAYEINDLIRKKEIKAREVTEKFLEKISTQDKKINSFLTVTNELALEAAARVDNLQAEEFGQITGCPIAIKDNMCISGVRTTCASKILENFVPVYTAKAVDKLIRGDSVILGKTNMDEFAFGSSTENSAFTVTKNPWDINRVPGGSSGGSAAAVAAGLAPVALGSDTGGSIRQPASLCGVVGMKPTYGRVSRYGLVAFASSLDQIGPITRNVKDCALTLHAISGKHWRDSTTIPDDVPDYLNVIDKEIKGMKIGLITELMGEGLEEGVKTRILEAIETFNKLGAVVEEVSVDSIKYATSAYYLIAPAEASSNLSRFDGVRYGIRIEGEDVVEMHKKTRGSGFGPEAKRRIMLGTYALSAGYYDAYYGQAQKVRTLIINDFDKAFGKFDVLISPTSPTTAFKIGEKMDDPLKMYLSDICTNAVNLAGIPAISIPCGLSDGLPVGLQIMGKVLDERTILQVANQFESVSGTLGIPEITS